MNKTLFSLFALFSVIFVTSSVYAAAPDGSGPWADEVISSNQGVMKNGQPVPAIRSNPQSAVGEAEGDTQDGHFFSLGFGGNIVLKFTNGVKDGVIVVEATNVSYPNEFAKIEVSQNGTTWINAGNVTQDGQVNMPENLSCVNYVRITDQSNPNDYPDDIADAYDVDGVKAVNADPCDGGNTGGGNNPSPTPTTSVDVTPTPTQTPDNNNSGSSGGSNNNNNNNNSQPKECTATKPGTPSITSVERTSGSTAKVSWNAVSPVTTYAISYGISPGNYQYGVPSTGNVTSFVIGGLDPNANYYFQITAINDCKPGDPSGNNSTGGQVLGASTSIGGGQVLGASTDVLGATGNINEMIAISLSFLGSILSYAVYRKSSR